jgi:hypothetical protein
MSVEKYLSEVIAKSLATELEQILTLKEVTRNTDLLGTYTEAAVRRLCRRVVHPLRVSEGAIIDYPMPKKLKQIDLIVWAPFPAPSVFEIDDFGLVPRSSAFGAMEIKRSNYSGVEKELEEFAKTAPGLIADGEKRPLPGVIGVICVLEKKRSERLEKLLKDGSAIALFERGSSKVSLRPKDILRLINFLHRVVRFYHREASLSPLLELRTDF